MESTASLTFALATVGLTIVGVTGPLLGRLFGPRLFCGLVSASTPCGPALGHSVLLGLQLGGELGIGILCRALALLLLGRGEDGTVGVAIEVCVIGRRVTVGLELGRDVGSRDRRGGGYGLGVGGVDGVKPSLDKVSYGMLQGGAAALAGGRNEYSV